MSMPKFHSSEEVAAALTTIDVLDVVRRAFLDHHAGRTLLPGESSLYWEAPDGGVARSIAMHGYLGGAEPRIGVKVINAAPNNLSRGMARADGLIALFDPLSGRITDLLAAAEISAARTAAVSTLAAQHLARESAKTLAILGAGVLGSTHLQLLEGTGLGIERACIFDLDSTRADELAQAVNAAAISLSIASSAEDALTDADIVITATTATEPYIPFEWLKPGALVVNVSLDDLHSDVFLQADAIYVDDWEIVRSDTRRRLGQLCRSGAITPARSKAAKKGRTVTGELGEVFAGTIPGRMSNEEIIVVNPFGLAISDIALGAAICAQRANSSPQATGSLRTEPISSSSP
jgi:ornithine cyclodeaminase/alanine dehydrogenase-like protein (mu-crystallin family)